MDGWLPNSWHSWSAKAFDSMISDAVEESSENGFQVPLSLGRETQPLAFSQGRQAKPLPIPLLSPFPYYPSTPLLFSSPSNPMTTLTLLSLAPHFCFLFGKFLRNFTSFSSTFSSDLRRTAWDLVDCLDAVVFNVSTAAYGPLTLYSGGPSPNTHFAVIFFFPLSQYLWRARFCRAESHSSLHGKARKVMHARQGHH